MRVSRPQRPAFRLVELLTVIAIAVIVIGLLLPATRHVQGVDARTMCQHNLKQIGLATHDHAASHQNALPALTSDRATPEYGKYNGGIFVTLLPFLEEEDLLNKGALALPRCTWAAPIPPNSTFPPPPGAVAP